MWSKLILILLICNIALINCCEDCYQASANTNCQQDPYGIDHYTLHMSVHPHLDAFWIFNFDSYYDPKPNEHAVWSYFSSNRFSSVKDIFNTAAKILTQSKQFRQANGTQSQQGHRSFFNSQMGFFKRWYFEQSDVDKEKVKKLLSTKYWEIVGGAYVQHDEGCAYYDDIIENFQIGLKFLKDQFNYHPKAAISADSFGHSQSTLAILAHLGIEGYFVERSDQHILLQNKTQFIWKAKSSNGRYYGALPTHIRWAIHGFQDQFIGNSVNQKICQTKERYISNLRRQNQFLKRILKSNHIMRYFGHDFQKFDNYSYTVIEGMMEQFSKEKCNRVMAVYGNPTQYFKTLMGQVWANKIKPIYSRQQDIFPIWDYDSGLYWTGYYTTDPYHKKIYRDAGRLLYTLRKAFLPLYLENQQTQKNKEIYQKLELFAQNVAYAQHHDGISGTSKYTVMDSLEQQLNKNIGDVRNQIMNQVFETEFPINTNNPIFNCGLYQQCKIPSNATGDIYLKIFNSAGDRKDQPVKVILPFGKYYKPDCQYEINCLCHKLPCQCSLYLYPQYFTYSQIRLKQAQQSEVNINILKMFKISQEYSYTPLNFIISNNGKKYSIGYKQVAAQSTGRNYKHLSRYGDLNQRSFSIRSGKYALGNNPNKISDISTIQKIYTLESPKMRIFIIKWKKDQMKTVITINKAKLNQWKVQTHSSARGVIQDLYLEIGTSINNQKKFFTDSNGWLVMERTLFHHEDYQAHFSPQKFDDIDGNSYPMTAFTYIQDQSDKVSVNTDRPQGVIAYQDGKIWINFDRLSTDDGKWVYETTWRNEYQKFTHVVTVNNMNNNERHIQTLYDQPLLIQGNSISPNERVEDLTFNKNIRDQWASIAGIDNNVKFNIRPWNDTTVTLRVQNMNDVNETKVGIYADKISPFLTTFYGNQLKFDQIQQNSLGGNMNYQTFLNQKWNWNKVVNLQKQNEIFEKVMQQNITLKPLEIRTFTFKGLKLIMDCQEPQKITFNSQKLPWKIDLNKEMVKRDSIALFNEQMLSDYLMNKDHCNQKSPVKAITVKTDTHLTKEGPKQIPRTPTMEPPLRPQSSANPQTSHTPQTSQTSQTPQNNPTQPTQPSQNIPKPQDPFKHESKPTAANTQNEQEYLNALNKVEGLQKLSVSQKFIYFQHVNEQVSKLKPNV